MDKIKKGNSIKNRIKKLKKESLIVYLLMLLGLIVGDLIYATAIIYMFPIVELILLMLKVDFIWRYITICSMNLFFMLIPVLSIMFGRVKLMVNEEKINNLYLFDDLEVVSKTKKISKKDDERQKKIIDEIMMKIEKLPRSKQIEILNYIKDKELMSDINVCNEIDKLSDENLNFLQDKFEDFLFPDFSEKEDVYDYSRKKRK